MKPKDKTKTKTKGYMNDPANQSWDEVVRFSVGLSTKDEINNRIVIDIDGQTVVKNNINENNDWSQLMNYVWGNYQDQITHFLSKTGGLTETLASGN